MEVQPVLGVRDSTWSDARDVGGGFTTTTWSAEIRSNSVSEVQVLGPRDSAQPAYARTEAGQWLRLEPGAWHTVFVAPAGRRRIAVEIDSAIKPAVRVITR